MPSSSLKNRRAISAGIRSIAEDRRHGASQLAARALQILAEVEPTGSAVPALTFQRDVLDLAREIARLRRGMAAISNAVAQAMELFRREVTADHTAESARGALHESAMRTLRELGECPGLVAGHFHRRFIKLRRVLTISYSSTLDLTLGHPSSPVDEVVVCEARPLLEGRKLASSLVGSERAPRVSVITDAQAAAALSHCEAVILGCDAILADGSVGNKTGSMLLAAIAGEMTKPVVVLGDSFKFARRREFDPEPHGGNEVWEQPPKGVRVYNRYFEIVPASLVTMLVLESGAIKPSRVRPLWRRALSRNTRGLR